MTASVAIVVLTYLYSSLPRRGPGGKGRFAAAVVSADNLVLVHGRIAMLDEPMLALMLLGAVLVLRGRPFSAGAACGAAALIKLPAVFGVLALMLYLLWVGGDGAEKSPGRAKTWVCGRLVAGFALTGFFGLWLLDLGWSAYRTPWSHVERMTNYGMTLQPSKADPTNSEPWRWLLNDGEFSYLRVDQTTAANGEVTGRRTLVHSVGR